MYRPTVHPRVCGADRPVQAHRRRHIGSPPRVRGRRYQREAEAKFPRFTPACAGQTVTHSTRPFPISVHPRVCGADMNTSRLFIGTCGSPPRVRGRRRSAAGRNCSRRFTPACAGQTGCEYGNNGATAVHPRVCGADTILAQYFCGSDGSPPRVRGRPPPSPPARP